MKVEGNPEHPGSRGGLCARGQAAPQAMYHPDRFRGPLVRDGESGSGDHVEVGWDEALDRVARSLSRLARGSDDRLGFGFVTNALTGHRLQMVRRFLAALGGGVHLVHEPFTVQTASRAARPLTGVASGFTAAIDRAGYVVSVGAELLESHVSPVRFGRGLAEMRRGRPGQRGKLLMASPRLSLTAAKADEWVPVLPGDEPSFVLALTALVLERAPSLSEGAAAYRELIRARVEPVTLASRLSLPLAKLERLAQELLSNGPAVVLAGGAALRSSRGFALATLVSHLNALLGAYGEGGLLEPNDAPVPFAPWPDVATESVATRPLAGSSLPRALFVSGANPAHSLPPGFGLEEAFADVELIVSFQSVPDETSRFADVILPESMSFERFEDDVPEAGRSLVASLSSPLLVRSLYDTRSMPDALIALGRRLGATDAFPWESYEDALREAWSGLDVSWSEAVERGGYWRESASVADVDVDVDVHVDCSYRFELEPLEEALATGERPADGLVLHVYPANAFGDGQSAHLPFLQELADPVTGVRWGSVVEIAASTSASLGIAHGDEVEVRNGDRAVTLRAHVSEGIHPGVAAIAAGQGHSHYGRYASGRGVNVFTLLDAASDDDGFLLTAPRVTITRLTKNAAEASLSSARAERENGSDA